MTKQKFSVLIPVYKKEISEYFDAALKSVFLNTILPDEVVICADGPLTPELDDVINKYEKKYPNIIKTVRFTNNRGLGLTLHCSTHKAVPPAPHPHVPLSGIRNPQKYIQ